MVKLSELLTDTRAVEVTIGQATVRVIYRPSGLTPRVEAQLRDTSSTAGRQLVEFLVAVLVDWDITDERGRPLPVTRERLEQLPTLLLSTIVQGIAADMTAPLSATPATSGAGSSLTERSEQYQSGTR